MEIHFRCSGLWHPPTISPYAHVALYPFNDDSLPPSERSVGGRHVHVAILITHAVRRTNSIYVLIDLPSTSRNYYCTTCRRVSRARARCNNVARNIGWTYRTVTCPVDAVGFPSRQNNTFWCQRARAVDGTSDPSRNNTGLGTVTYKLRATYRTFYYTV